jgi:hypothetical protein
MSPARFHRLVAAFLGSLSLVGCVVPPPPPLTSLDGRVCTPAPDFTGSHLLELGARQTIVPFDQNSPCWQAGEGKRSAYVLFTLPNSTEPYLLSVTSNPIGQALIAPHLYLLDGVGNTLRDASRDSFAFHGSSLSMTLRAYPNERYLLVASEPDTLGSGGSQLRDGVVVQNYSTGYGGFVSVHTGFEQNQQYVYAVNGMIAVSAGPIPKVN